MKLAAYLRVSTDRQAERGHGLRVQRREIAGWARQRGHTVIEWHSDEGVSGSNALEARSALPSAIEALRQSRAQGLIVYRLDRLARDLVVQEAVLGEVRRFGARVFSTAPGESEFLVDDPEDPSRKLIRQVLGAINEYERGLIALRLRAGRQSKGRDGGYAYGAPPLGYRAENGALVPHDVEQRAIRRARELRDAGFSLREVAALLESEGHRPKRATVWHPTSVARALARTS